MSLDHHKFQTDTVEDVRSCKPTHAFHAYIQNYPQKSENAIKEAYADQIVMKIMPRLRGLETTQPHIKRTLDKMPDVLPDELKEKFREAQNKELREQGGASTDQFQALQAGLVALAYAMAAPEERRRAEREEEKAGTEALA